MARSSRHQRFRSSGPGRVRIIGGKLRGQWIPYSGDPRTRPMKDRVREAVFSLLGGSLEGYHVWDVFAGTGALGIEALSRGATKATFLERHWPTCQLLQQTIQRLALESCAQVIHTDAFYWMTSQWQPELAPAVLFCSPPYSFYQSHTEHLVAMLEHFLERAFPESLAVVESDTQFDLRWKLPTYTWLIRDYPPARIAIAQNVPDSRHLVDSASTH